MASVAKAYGLSTSTLAQLEVAATTGTAAAYQKVPGITAAIQAAAGSAVQHAYIQAFKTIYYVSIAFGVIAIVIAALTKDIQSKMTNRIAVSEK